MSTLVTVTNRAPEGGPIVLVTVQAIKDDGRERVANGRHQIEPGASKDLLVDEDQCFRVSEGVSE